MDKKNQKDFRAHTSEEIAKIRRGSGHWDFKDFFPRPKEDNGASAKLKSVFSNDPFTRSFLYLYQVLKKHEENKQNNSLHPFLCEEEKQGIFLMDNKQVNIYEHAFILQGIVDPRRREYLHAYSRELRKFVAETTAFKYTPINRYFSQVTLFPSTLENSAVHMPMACSMNLSELFYCCLVPLQDSLERVVYQVAETMREDVVGAGFFYTGKKREIAIHEIKQFTMI